MIRSGYRFVAVEVKVKKYNKRVNISSLGIFGDLGAVSRDDRIFEMKVIVNFHHEHFIVTTQTAPGSPRMHGPSGNQLVLFSLES